MCPQPSPSRPASADLLLVSYLGIDFRNKGERVYRLLDSALIFHGVCPASARPCATTSPSTASSTRATRTLFFFSYKCYADGELILELHDACAGFFSSRSWTPPSVSSSPEEEKAERARVTKDWFKPLAYTEKDHLTPGPGAARPGHAR